MKRIEKSLNWLGYCYIDIQCNVTDKLLQLGLGDLITGYAHSDELKMYYIVFDGYFTFSGWEPRGEHYVNCHSNEDLFLAIAALRNDSDYMQWFISEGAVDGSGNPVEWWVQCTSDKFTSTDTNIKWRKANVDELIKHFS